MSDPVALILSKLPDAKPVGENKWLARCPAHDDRRPSLSIARGSDGCCLLKCHAGCSTEAILLAMSLKMRDLFPTDTDTMPQKPKKQRDSVSKPHSNGQQSGDFLTCQAAVAELERRHGKRSMEWPYHDAHGKPVGMIVRWNLADGGKDIRPVALHGDGWRIGGMPVPRPLYRLPDLLASKGRVFVVEGEKAADAARSIGLIATTSPHGSNGYGKADWTSLAGRDVVILPDHDKSGRGYVEGVAAILEALTPQPTVRTVELPGLTDGDDIVEYIDAAKGAGLDDAAIRANINAMADRQPALELARPRRAVEAWRPFPVDALPEPVRGFVKAAALAIGCDPSFVALPVLAVLASAIGNSRRIKLKHVWTEPAVIWAVIVGESGTKKSPPFDAAMSPLYVRQKQARKRYAKELDEYKRRQREYKRDLKKWEHKGEGAPPEEPVVPVCDRCFCDDATIEAVAPLLQNQWRGLLLKKDELSSWIGCFDKYSGNKKSGDAGKWIEMHGARPVVIDRKTSGTIDILMAALCIAGGIQPGILARAIGQEHRENGLLARLLLALPPRRVSKWTEADLDPKLKEAYRLVVEWLFSLEPDHGEDGDPEPVVLDLTPEAKRTWIDFSNAHAQEHVELTGDLSAAWSKLEGYAARLALVIHLTRLAAGEQVDPARIDVDSMMAGIALSRWFAHETKRVYSILSEDEGQKSRRELVELIERKGGIATARDLMRWRDRQYSTTSEAQTALAGLIQAGLGRWELDEHDGGAGRPVQRFILIAEVEADTIPSKHCENGDTVSFREKPESPNTFPDEDEGEAEWTA